jgi:hypothetical protein
MHEQRFPESPESPERRSARAVAQLEYEERAQTGFRRRRHGQGDPWAAPDDFQVDREVTNGELFAGYLAGFAVVLACVALFLRPLLFAFLAVLFAIGGLIGGGQASKIAKMALVIGAFTFVLGMLFSIWTERPVI